MTALAQFANRFARLAALLALAVPATAQTTTTWTGTTSSAWNVAANWSAGVPSAGIDAIVAAAPNAPSTNAVVGAACQSLTVQAGGTLTIDAGFDLAVQANVTWDGGRGGSGALVLAGTGIAVGSFPTTLISGNYANRYCTNSNVSSDTECEAYKISSLTIQAIPVPGAVWFMGSALGLMAWVRRRIRD